MSAVSYVEVDRHPPLLPVVEEGPHQQFVRVLYPVARYWGGDLRYRRIDMARGTDRLGRSEGSYADETDNPRQYQRRRDPNRAQRNSQPGPPQETVGRYGRHRESLSLGNE